VSTGQLGDAAGAAAPRDAVIEVERVTLRFGGVTSLADVSLYQLRGEILAVIGPNGAGKTSLFNCLTGVYQPQEGSIVFNGADGARRPIVGRKPHRVNQLGIARTFQTSRLFNALTAFENVKIGIEARQRTGPIGAMLRLPRTRREEREGDARVEELLSFVGLTERANELASSLPYGDQRRLEIARALGTQPELLLLDEPAAGTNPVEKEELARLIRRMNGEMGLSVLLIEHDMRLVMSLAHRITVLNFGSVIASGTPDEVRADPLVIEAYLGAAPADETVGEGTADRTPAS
jgi:branched-chain amino acid transport system ATP-binding protein